VRTSRGGDDSPSASSIAELPSAGPPELAFGSELRRLRVREGLTREGLAERAQLSVATLAALEVGQRRRPYPHTAVALADALGLIAAERKLFVELAVAIPQRAQGVAQAPMRTRPEPRSRLPVPPTTLIGREADIAAASALLDPAQCRARLLSLVGSAGVGKTRLAISVARALVDAFADGVFFVDLAPVNDPQLVAATIARALDLRESDGRTSHELVLEHLNGRQVLLVLDNFEHLLAAAPFLADLLQGCARVALLVTSRTTLRLRGEQRFPVLPLPTPADEPDVADAITDVPAVRLFVERAQAVAADFALDDDNMRAVAAICRRLEGVPLAIELAAARVGLLTPETLLQRLNRCLALLTHGAADLPIRQQTLHTALAWSHDLLAPDAQVVFRRLAVFAGGWTIAAAEAVCAESVLGADAVLNELQVLADHSLVVRSAGSASDDPRFGMLETIREFALDRLEASGELGAVRERHFNWCLAYAEAAERELRGPRQHDVLSRLGFEADNMRSALTWSLSQLHSRARTPHPDAALRLGAALARAWSVRGQSVEGCAWLEKLLAASHSDEPTRDPRHTSAVRARALMGLAWLYGDHGQFVRGQECTQESLVLFRAAGDERGMATALLNLGHLADYRGDTEQALALFADSAEHARAAGEQSQLGEALGWVARSLYRKGDIAAARATLLEGTSLLEASGDIARLAGTLFIQGTIEAEQNNSLAAESALIRSTDLYQRAGDRVGETKAIGWLGYVALSRGDYPAARAYLTQCVRWGRDEGLNDLPKWLYAVSRLWRAEGQPDEAWSSVREGLALHQQMGCPAPAVRGLEIAAGILATRSRAADELAIRVLGAAEAKRRAISVGVPLAEHPEYTCDVALVRNHVSPEDFARAWNDGEAMAFEHAVAQVLGVGARL
jgi:predicted ATPase/transcriptional regulator with XRE-family HTH domain